MAEFEYELTVQIKNKSVPEQKDIPEFAQVRFRVDPEHKTAGVQAILKALSKTWPELRQLHKLKKRSPE